MMSEWMKVMLEEIERKKAEAEQAEGRGGMGASRSATRGARRGRMIPLKDDRASAARTSPTH